MIVAFGILVLFALALYGMDYDLRALRDEMCAEEIGAGLDSGLDSYAGTTATLTAAGADSPFDWDTAA